jgi:hypothetical protein
LTLTKKLQPSQNQHQKSGKLWRLGRFSSFNCLLLYGFMGVRGGFELKTPQFWEKLGLVFRKPPLIFSFTKKMIHPQRNEPFSKDKLRLKLESISSHN